MDGMYFNWPRGVKVSTLDSESGNRGSNPREASVLEAVCPCSLGSLVCAGTWKGLNYFVLTGPVAQWIRHRPTEPGIAGSSPAGVIILGRNALLLLQRALMAGPDSAPIAWMWPFSKSRKKHVTSLAIAKSFLESEKHKSPRRRN